MKLKNVLIVVQDIEQSRQFYRDLFGLDLVQDNDGNMILADGLFTWLLALAGAEKSGFPPLRLGQSSPQLLQS